MISTCARCSFLQMIDINSVNRRLCQPSSSHYTYLDGSPGDQAGLGMSAEYAISTQGAEQLALALYGLRHHNFWQVMHNLQTIREEQGRCHLSCIACIYMSLCMCVRVGLAS